MAHSCVFSSAEDQINSSRLSFNVIQCTPGSCRSRAELRNRLNLSALLVHLLLAEWCLGHSVYVSIHACMFSHRHGRFAMSTQNIAIKM